MTNCTNTCSLSSLKIIYIFNSRPSSCEGANAICQESNGTLAKELNRTDYTLINSCCKKRQRFRIGLVSNSTCNGTRPCFWVGSPANCVDQGDLKKIGPANHSNCQTVSINIGGSSDASQNSQSKIELL